MMFVFDSVLTCVAAMDLHISGLIFAFFASALLFQLVFEVRFL